MMDFDISAPSVIDWKSDTPSFLFSGLAHPIWPDDVKLSRFTSSSRADSSSQVSDTAMMQMSLKVCSSQHRAYNRSILLRRDRTFAKMIEGKGGLKGRLFSLAGALSVNPQQARWYIVGSSVVTVAQRVYSWVAYCWEFVSPQDCHILEWLFQLYRLQWECMPLSYLKSITPGLDK